MKRLLLAAVVATLLVACGYGASVQRGIDQYQLGNYQRAEKQFASLEDNQDAMNPKGRVRYMVFRGLALYQLGDREAARDWLERGHAAYLRGDAGWIDANTRAAMQNALADLERPPPRPAPPPSPRATASAD